MLGERQAGDREGDAFQSCGERDAVVDCETLVWDDIFFLCVGEVFEVGDGYVFFVFRC